MMSSKPRNSEAIAKARALEAAKILIERNAVNSNRKANAIWWLEVEIINLTSK